MEALIAGACALAGTSGMCFGVLAARARAAGKARRRLRTSMSPGDGAEFATCESGGLVAWELRMLQQESRRLRSERLLRVLRSPPWSLGLGSAPALLDRAGLDDSASRDGLLALRAMLALAGLALGLLAGSVFSAELALVLGVLGAALGFGSVVWALKREAVTRNANMERNLSQMIEVVVLGLQSGLSFERSFALYPRYFDTGLAHAMERASGQWGMGLSTREEALRKLEASYDSVLLSRVVGSMVRSLRFGTSIVDSLEASAIEAREIHRARMEERVAKVAVKMMLPVGALILPAMLLLVLGPVLLELIEGF